MTIPQQQIAAVENPALPEGDVLVLLLLASIAMGTYLIRLHEKTQERMLATVERVPLARAGYCLR